MKRQTSSMRFHRANAEKLPGKKKIYQFNFQVPKQDVWFAILRFAAIRPADNALVTFPVTVTTAKGSFKTRAAMLSDRHWATIGSQMLPLVLEEGKQQITLELDRKKPVYSKGTDPDTGTMDCCPEYTGSEL